MKGVGRSGEILVILFSVDICYEYFYCLSKAPQSGDPATALALGTICQNGTNIIEKSAQKPIQKRLQNPLKMHLMVQNR